MSVAIFYRKLTLKHDEEAVSEATSYAPGLAGPKVEGNSAKMRGQARLWTVPKSRRSGARNEGLSMRYRAPTEREAGQDSCATRGRIYDKTQNHHTVQGFF